MDEVIDFGGVLLLELGMLVMLGVVVGDLVGVWLIVVGLVFEWIGIVGVDIFVGVWLVELVDFDEFVFFFVVVWMVCVDDLVVFIELVVLLCEIFD